jgi:hypothetical protein
MPKANIVSEQEFKHALAAIPGEGLPSATDQPLRCPSENFISVRVTKAKRFS